MRKPVPQGFWRVQLWLAIPALCLILFTACGESEDSTLTSGSETTASQAQAADQTVGAGADGAETDGSGNAEPTAEQAAALLDISGTDVEGQTVDLSSYAGRDLILFFWAPWCSYCQGEAPQVSEIANEFANDPDFAIVGVGGRDNEGAIKGFVEDYDLTSMTNLVDVDGAIWNHFGVTGQPAFVLVNDDGRSQLVFGTIDDLRSVVDDLQAL
ncbi:MAG: TlpA family protein disulfide reductase [Actinobacteria bacterium]|nr:TlpA family protein disulfide reductase [Actinomycetota bacterium]MCB9389034.1 TlpA family protein disulfide reductase [Acidimicrobiia bacterium]